MNDNDRTQARMIAHAKGAYPAPADTGRSRNMQAIRRTDTTPEVALRKALHALGYRYRKDVRLDVHAVRVRPDIVFTRAKVAVFVDGCFWHSCPEHGRVPTANVWYWKPKLERTVVRDHTAIAALNNAGWRVVRVWEHEPVSTAVAAVVAALEQRIEHGSEAIGQP